MRLRVPCWAWLGCGIVCRALRPSPGWAGRVRGSSSCCHGGDLGAGWRSGLGDFLGHVLHQRPPSGCGPGLGVPSPWPRPPVAPPAAVADLAPAFGRGSRAHVPEQRTVARGRRWSLPRGMSLLLLLPSQTMWGGAGREQLAARSSPAAGPARGPLSAAPSASGGLAGAARRESGSLGRVRGAVTRSWGPVQEPGVPGPSRATGEVTESLAPGSSCTLGTVVRTSSHGRQATERGRPGCWARLCLSGGCEVAPGQAGAAVCWDSVSVDEPGPGRASPRVRWPHRL